MSSLFTALFAAEQKTQPWSGTSSNSPGVSLGDFPTAKRVRHQKPSGPEQEISLEPHNGHVPFYLHVCIPRWTVSENMLDGISESVFLFGTVPVMCHPICSGCLSTAVPIFDRRWRPSLVGWRPSIVGWRPSLGS